MDFPGYKFLIFLRLLTQRMQVALIHLVLRMPFMYWETMHMYQILILFKLLILVIQQIQYFQVAMVNSMKLVGFVFMAIMPIL